MAQTNYTPISLYYSTTVSAAPSAGNLVNGELAINITDGKLYYKDNTGAVKVIAGTGGTGVVAGSNTQIQFNNNGVFGASSSLTWDGSFLTVASIKDSALTSGRVTYAGASGLLTDSANMTFNGTTLTAGGFTTTGTTSTGVLSVTGNTTLGDATADTVTVNGTITSNLIFTDNTYDIGASGATRPRNLNLANSLLINTAASGTSNIQDVQAGINATSLTTTTIKNLGAKFGFTGVTNVDGYIFGGIAMGGNGEEYAGIAAYDNGASAATGLKFFTGTTSGIVEAATVTSTGNWGIGVAAPSGKFEVSSGSAGVTVGDLLVDTANNTVYVGRQSSTSSDNTLFVVRNRVGVGLSITGTNTPTGTGFFIPAANYLGFSSNSTEVARFDSSGRFLVGTNAYTVSSSEKFEVYNGMTLLDFNSDSVAPLYVKNRSTTAATIQPYTYFSDSGGNRAGFGIKTSDASFHQFGQGGFYWYTGSSGFSGQAMQLSSSAAKVLGVGVTLASWTNAYNQGAIQFGPVGALASISASSTNNQTTLSSNLTDAGYSPTYIYTDAASQLKLSNGQFYFYYAPSGTAGTGAGLLTVATISNSGINLPTVSSGNANISFDGSTFTLVSNSSSASMVFSTYSTERARITSGGSVCIGTSTATRLLTLGGGSASIAVNDTNGGIYMGTGGSGAGGFALNCAMARAAVAGYHIASSSVGDLCIGPDAGSNIRFGYAASGSPSLNLAMTIASTGVVSTTGNLSVGGALSKGSGSFRIKHPLPQLAETHQLVHSFIEGPQADLIYRGKVNLVNGTATVNIDQSSGMTEGTFVVLCRDVQCFTTNESDWTAVRGSVSGNILTIEAQDQSCTASISWMVIGERQDKHMYDTDWTDDNGKVIVEPLKPIES